MVRAPRESEDTLPKRVYGMVGRRGTGGRGTGGRGTGGRGTGGRGTGGRGREAGVGRQG